MLSLLLLMNNTTSNLLTKPLLTDCWNLAREANKQITHAYWEANQCADALAKLGASSLSSFVVFLNPPPMVESIIASNKANLRCKRMVNSWFFAISMVDKKKKKKQETFTPICF